jgi:hypothetical protein
MADLIKKPLLSDCAEKDRLMSKWITAFGLYSAARLALARSMLPNLGSLTKNVERTAKKTELARMAFIDHRMEHGCSVG